MQPPLLLTHDKNLLFLRNPQLPKGAVAEMQRLISPYPGDDGRGAG